MSNNILISRGTPLTLASSNATVLFTLACATNSGIQSNVFDLGEPHAEEYELNTQICAQTAPTAGGVCDIYLAPMNNNGLYPGGATGINGQYIPGVNSANLTQLSWLGSVIVTNNSGIQIGETVIRPVCRSGCIIIKNNTNTPMIDLSGVVTLTPLIPQII